MGLLSDAIRDRVLDLGIPVKRVSDAGYVAQSTLERVMRGQESLRSPRHEADLERGLGWIAGSLKSIRAGGKPYEIPVKGWPRRDKDWRAAVEQAWTDWSSSAEGKTFAIGPDPVTIGLSKEIRIGLIRKDMTNDELAAATGIPMNTLTARLEGKSDWTLTEILAIALALDVSPLKLLEPLIGLEQT